MIPIFIFSSIGILAIVVTLATLIKIIAGEARIWDWILFVSAINVLWQSAEVIDKILEGTTGL